MSCNDTGQRFNCFLKIGLMISVLPVVFVTDQRFNCPIKILISVLIVLLRY